MCWRKNGHCSACLSPPRIQCGKALGRNGALGLGIRIAGVCPANSCLAETDCLEGYFPTAGAIVRIVILAPPVQPFHPARHRWPGGHTDMCALSLVLQSDYDFGLLADSLQFANPILPLWRGEVFKLFLIARVSVVRNADSR